MTKLTEKTTHAYGILRIDATGRVWLDECPDANAHLLAAKPEDSDRRTCAVLVDEKIFPESNGQPGHWTIYVSFEPEAQ